MSEVDLYQFVVDQGGFLAALILILSAGNRRWWVFGWVYRELADARARELETAKNEAAARLEAAKTDADARLAAVKLDAEQRLADAKEDVRFWRDLAFASLDVGERLTEEAGPAGLNHEAQRRVRRRGG